MITAGIDAMAALTMNTTIEMNGILMSTIVTSLLFSNSFSLFSLFVFALTGARCNADQAYTSVALILAVQAARCARSESIGTASPVPPGLRSSLMPARLALENQRVVAAGRLFLRIR